MGVYVLLPFYIQDPLRLTKSAGWELTRGGRGNRDVASEGATVGVQPSGSHNLASGKTRSSLGPRQTEASAEALAG